MESAHYPKHEQQRLDSLEQYHILNTPPEEDYDRITRLATILCGVPIALINMVDHDRVWVKSASGIEITETPRSIAFCAHAILEPESIFVVPDTLEDKRFFDNPFVANAPNIRFYAGCPLTVESGDTLGALCIVDIVPRTLTAEQAEALKILGAQAVAAIEARMQKRDLLTLTEQLQESNRLKNNDIKERIKAENRFKEINEIYQLIIESSPDLVFVKDAEFRFVQANRALLTAFGDVTGQQIIGTTAFEKFSPEEMEGYLANDRRAFKEGSSETIETASFEPGKELTLFTKKVRFTNVKGEEFILGIARDITEIKRTEAALRESSQLNNAILSSAAHMIVATDNEGKILLFNNEAERLLGYSAREVVGKHTPALWHLEDEVKARALELSKHLKRTIAPSFEVFTTSVLRHGSEEREWTFVRKDGSHFPAYLTTTALKDDDQNVVGVLGIIQDITERKRMLEELRVSEERLHLASSGTSDGLWDWNLLTGEHYFSPRFEEMVGHEPGEMTPHIDTFHAKLHPDDRERILRTVQRHFNEHIPYDIEYRVQNKAGRYLWLNARGQASFDEKEKPVRMTGFVTDITRRKEAEEAQRLEKMETTKLLAMIQNAPDFIGMADMNGKLQYHNKAASQMIGYSEPEELMRLTLPEIHPEWAMKAIMEQAIPTVFEKGVWRGETAVLHREGYEIPVSQTVTLYRDDEGTPVCTTTIIQDISERKRLERLKNEFVSTVSHELRTPLTSIRGSLGLMRGGAVGALPFKAMEMTEIAYNNAERLILLINDILDIDKIESGEMRFDMNVHDLGSLIEQAVESNRPYGERFCVQFVIEPFTPTARVAVDGNRFIQVLSNLLSNAAKFSTTGEAVHVRVERHDAHIRICVIDSGSGISIEFQGRIFSKFAQADASSSRHKPGTGLGLNISKQMIEKMGGSIGFVSGAGQGSNFWIELPEYTGEFAIPSATHVSARAEMPLDSTTLPVILHAEDDPDLRSIIAHSLRGKAIIHAATTIEDAATLLTSHQYDLLILDLSLPDGSGLALLDQLRGQPASPRVMILSATEVTDRIRNQVDAALVKSRVSEDSIIDHVFRLIIQGKNTSRA